MPGGGGSKQIVDSSNQIAAQQLHDHSMPSYLYLRSNFVRFLSRRCTFVVAGGVDMAWYIGRSLQEPWARLRKGSANRTN